MFFTHNVGVPAVYGVDPRFVGSASLSSCGVDPRFGINTLVGNSLVDPRAIAASCGIDARNCDPRVLAACGLTPQSISLLSNIAPQAIQPFVASCVAQACSNTLNSSLVDPRLIAASCGIDARSCDPRILSACGLTPQTISVLNSIAPHAVPSFVAQCVAQACTMGVVGTSNILPNTTLGINSFPWLNGCLPVNPMTSSIPATPSVIPSVRTFSPAPVGLSPIPTTQATVIF
jgi:uncharacterized membrane protein